MSELRERTIQALCAHFASDHLELEEFERRLDVAHRTTTPAELELLLQDLPALARAATAGLAPSPPAPLPAGREELRGRSRVVVAILGGVAKRGRWVPPRQLYVYAFMGGAELDFREAVLPPGETRVTVLSLMGGADIIVPPELGVVTSGIAILGGFEQEDAAPPPGDPSASVLRINGVVLLGGVEVSRRRPGESARDARRRRREERRHR